METKVWIKTGTGEQYAEGPGEQSLNGNKISHRPLWVEGEPTYVFGTLLHWGGGECPVIASTLVRCLFRHNNPYIGPAISPSLTSSGRAVMWQHAPFLSRNNPAFDIIAYQEAL